MDFNTRIQRIRDGVSSQASSQEINIFAHVFKQRFLDIDLTKPKMNLTQYPYDPKHIEIEESDRKQHFALIMIAPGHQNLVYRDPG
ncbi:hypothetical protein DID80_08610 [Candidatus Marinamargulisbacteria bacterium SCGC AAA071-K20]|nr:hypothetical protein DID80_08610 [Candidatus Marinamargulisbacteria bacterium SCGC AAA071-K20]